MTFFHVFVTNLFNGALDMNMFLLLIGYFFGLRFETNFVKSLLSSSILHRIGPVSQGSDDMMKLWNYFLLILDLNLVRFRKTRLVLPYFLWTVIITIIPTVIADRQKTPDFMSTAPDLQLAVEFILNKPCQAAGQVRITRTTLYL